MTLPRLLYTFLAYSSEHIAKTHEYYYVSAWMHWYLYERVAGKCARLTGCCIGPSGSTFREGPWLYIQSQTV
jgi:hypothetical protein